LLVRSARRLYVFCCALHHRPPTSTLFPYTTLFRSQGGVLTGAALTLYNSAVSFATGGGSLSDFANLWLYTPLPNNGPQEMWGTVDRKSTRLNSSHSQISYAVFCLKKKTLAEKVIDS